MADILLVVGIAGVAALAVFMLVLIYRIRKEAGPSQKEMDALYNQFNLLIKRKAKYLSMLEVLDDAKKYGKISTQQYADQANRLKKKIDSVDKEIDNVVSRLALPYYKNILKQESAVEGKKLNYLITLQEDKKKLQAKVLELEKTLDALRRKLKVTEEAKEELEDINQNMEEEHKEKMLEMESRIDQASKKIAALQKELESLKQEKKTLEDKLLEVSKREKEYKKKAWVHEKELEKTGKTKEELEKMASEVASEERELEEKFEKAKQRMDEYYHKLLLLQTALERYSDYIETNEARTIQDVKASVQPKNKKVLEIAEIITSEIPEYSPDRDLLKACRMAYERITERIASVPGIGVTFWMKIEDMLEKKIADYEDKAILLCSVLEALGADARVLILQMSDGTNIPVVELKHAAKVYWLDPNHKHDFDKYSATSREEIMKVFKAEDTSPVSILYEFNDQEYKQKE